MGRLGIGIGIDIGGDAVGAAALPTIAALSASFETETGTFVTAIGGATAAEKYAIDRFYKYVKSQPWWARNAANANAGFWLTCQATKAKCLVNMLHPGSKDFAEVGTITFAAFDGVSTSGVANYLDPSIPINTQAQNSTSIGGYCVSTNAGVASSYDMGCVDASSTTRLLLCARIATDVMAGACMNATVTTIGASTDFNFSANGTWKSFSRNAASGSAGHAVYNNRIKRLTQSAASIAPAGTTPIKFLYGTGATASAQKWACFFLMDGLSDTEMAYLAAAAEVLCDSFRYGLPAVQPAGYGDATVTADVIGYGNSMATLNALWRAKQQGRTVAWVCDEMTESVEQLGGMPANGLDWVDIASAAATPTVAMFREIGKEANALVGHADSNDQTGMSIQSQAWNLQTRKMCDPNRATGNMIGRDIPIYFSTGLRSLTKNGSNKITSLTTNDGRVLNASIYIDASYSGDLVYLSGVPVTSGREADGTGVEVAAGFHLSQRGRPGDDSTANVYLLDPYLTSGVPASGLLPDITLPPSTTDGAAFAGTQAMNIRLQATTSVVRRAPFAGGPIAAQPANYVATRYELLGRYLAACTAAGHTPTKDDLMTFTRTTSNSCIDLNNASGVSSDFGGSGNRYLAAGNNLTLRRAAIQDIIDFTLGMLWWLGNSGDARIPTALKNDFLTNYGLEATGFLDLHTMFPMGVPKMIYVREPNWRINNTASAGFRLTGNDGVMADGTTPRSTNTIACGKYNSFDHHAEAWYAEDWSDGNGVKMGRYHSYSNSAAGGTNKKIPIPIETVMPVKADCPNLLTPTCPSMTSYMYSVARMEHSLCNMGEACGIIANLAVAGALAVQDVLYSDVRTALLALTDITVAHDIPQVN